MSVDSDVRAAAAALVDAFGGHRTQEYFASFSADATFLFHNQPGLLTSRAEYERLWREWESEGFRVLACRSLEPSVQVLDDDHAVFTHRVRTSVAGSPDAEQAEQAERETMVFRRSAEGQWLVVHEHLSIDPESE
ncbi:nuclear transport factor 2 family protein [Jatrophihabitans telluris]|uniref:Nuclear transport factor 2 family protein n=1 Tax=Jatrophihabitans telluris TaxID=2038343 RepID=A0ABY4R4N2_9ACTN|nr:nuclear transport factor 2 family protein [Jatrophihabitans telluris]UQX89844.1 nuclear transport factor 2 family protein [Jatrophihabitans telluris]